MKYDTRLLTKLAIIFLGLLFLVCVWLGRRENKGGEPEGEKIACADAAILMDALNVPVPETVEYAGEGTYLTYGQYRELCGALDIGGGKLPDYTDRYTDDSSMLKKDWYEAYRIMLAYLDQESSIWETEVFLLKADVERQEAYTDSGAAAYAYSSPDFERMVLHDLKVYVQGERLLTVVEELPGKYVLPNVWVTEAADGNLECFYRGTDFRAASERETERESVADLTFQGGRIVDVEEKKEKVHGKLLRASDEELEIEGRGVYPIAEDMEVYKLYGSLETLGHDELRIGCADTDYVIDEGRVCACLVSEKEAADRIRVLLKNTTKNSDYYEEAELVVDGEKIRVRADDLEVGERRSYRCAALTDRVILHTAGIRRGDDAYRGMIECYRSEDGLVLINELPLEEYLYAVVPSEMPASYPAEALKAQAICARTYAYRYILCAGLPELGAHVDDTTSYQVYHNMEENAASTNAVKETDGEILTDQGEPAELYYYSTSCGTGGSTPEELRDEDNFRAFITAASTQDLECEEPWYRWTYSVKTADWDGVLARVKERYAASPASVLTEAEGGYYVSQPVERLGQVRNICVAERGDGGVADELLIEAETGTYKIVGEYNIRYVLCDGESEAIRQDGSAVVPASLIPSGFFVIDAGKSGESMVGYTLTGGGYGHGVGMSQNGARALGERGEPCGEILDFFFADCELKEAAAPADL